MDSPDRTLEQVARDRVHAVARRRPSARADGAVPGAPWAERTRAPDLPGGRRARRNAATSVPEPVASHARPPTGEDRWLPVRPAGPDPEPSVAPDLEPGGGSIAPDFDPGGGSLTPELGPGDDPTSIGRGRDDRTGVDLGRETRRGPLGRPGTDVADVSHRGRAEALAAAAAGYTEAYGHPLDHPGEEAPADGRRWWLSTRHAVVAGVAVAVLATGVVVRATTEIPDPPVELAAAHAAPLPGVAAGATAGPAGAGAGPGDGNEALESGTGTVTGPAAVAGSVAGSVVGTAGEAGPAPTSTGAAAAAPAPAVVVHVVGQVPAPGVLTLPAGSRVSDAVAAAGGPAPDADLSLVNLARVVVDGEQIHVPARGEAVRAPAGAPAAGSAGAPATGAGPVPVPLNTADLAALDSLPGIGPVLAQRILDWRTDNGPFRSVEELGEVSGIGEALLTRLRPLVRV